MVRLLRETRAVQSEIIVRNSSHDSLPHPPLHPSRSGQGYKIEAENEAEKEEWEAKEEWGRGGDNTQQEMFCETFCRCPR